MELASEMVNTFSGHVSLLRRIGTAACCTILLALLPSRLAAAPVGVVVSILPEKYFVDRVGGGRVDVSVMVGPGQSPATYEPMPRQLAALMAARVYFRIGVPFERVWMARVRAANQRLLVVDLTAGIERRMMMPADDRAPGGASTGTPDPHVWTSPPLAKRMARSICDSLERIDPAGARDYERNFTGVAADLDRLDGEIRRRLASRRQPVFMTYHPSWGYFADTYGLKQIAIEREGKDPGPRTLLHLVELGKRLGIEVIFVEPQFSRRTAEVVARQIGARIVAVDPLAEDYIGNLRRVAAALAEATDAR